jgi:tRNA A37 methylthiotransferase MiaB
MRRPYRIEDVIGLLKEIKEVFPQILIKTDIMIGFPSETDEDFEHTLKTIREVKFDDLAVFNFSGIPGTAAFKMKKQIPENVQNQRQKLLWEKYPFLRYSLELENGRLWIDDKKDCLKVPVSFSAYSIPANSRFMLKPS